VTEKICGTATAVSGYECAVRPLKEVQRFQLCNATKRGPSPWPVSIPQLDDRVGHFGADEVACDRACAELRRLRLGPSSVGQDSPKRENSSGAQRAQFLSGPGPKGEQGYDIRDDQALSSLQTAINQKSAHRHCAMRLPQACLAGVVYSQHAPRGLLFRFVQAASRHTTLS
jgi:hypothetical protein